MVYAEDDTSDGNLSFYKTASAAAIYFDAHDAKVDADDSDVEHNHFDVNIFGWDLGDIPLLDSEWPDDTDKITSANAGGLLGFADPDYETFFGGMISRLNAAELARSYDSLRAYPSLYRYAMYGHALQAIGIDGVGAAGLGDILGFIIRNIWGFFILLAYLVASAADIFFIVMLKILNLLNPFNLIGKAWSNMYGGADPDFLDSNSPFAVIGGALSEFFGALYDLCQTIFIPLWLVILVATLLLSRKKREYEGTSKVGLFLKRVAFVFLFVPIVGTLYTSTINGLTELFESPEDDTTSILDSLFVDFEGWVNTSNLVLPYVAEDNIVIAYDSKGIVDMSKTTNPRTIARAINDQTHRIEQYGTFNNNNTNVIARIGDGMELIQRYMSNDGISESEYETSYKALPDRATKGDRLNNSEAFAIGLNGSNGTYSTGDGNLYAKTAMFEDLAITASSDNFKKGAGDGIGFFTLGSSMSGDVDSRFRYTHDGLGFADNSRNQDHADTNKDNSFEGVLSGRGLSALSMYNYLASNFSEGAMSTYSSKMLFSGMSKGEHKCVNIVGAGTFEKFLNSVAILTEFVALAILGLGFGVAIVKSTFFKSIKTIGSLPLALMGSLQSIKKVFVIVISMIGEILVTILVYSIMRDLIIQVNGDAFMKSIGDSVVNTVNEISGTVVDMGTGDGLGSHLTVYSVISIPAIIASIISQPFVATTIPVIFQVLADVGLIAICVIGMWAFNRASSDFVDQWTKGDEEAVHMHKRE